MTIIVSSAKLALETFFVDSPPESLEARVFSVMDISFTLIFSFEALIKVIMLGLVIDKGSYLRYPENAMDMFIVVTSILDNAMSSEGQNSLS